MTRLYVILIVASTCGIGLAYLLVLRKRLQDRTGRAAAFLQYLHDFLQIRSVSSENYSWLLRHSYEMQADMGEFGVMGYRPAYHRCGVLWSSNSAGDRHSRSMAQCCRKRSCDTLAHLKGKQER